MPELIVIGGPTASGKTQAAIQLAQFLKCPILSADSRQFFREMSIGTAKPTAEELSQAEHFFINNKSIQEDYSSGDYEREALELLENLFQSHQKVILVGGSGLYIDAVCFGMDNLPKSKEIRNELNQICTNGGFEELRQKLNQLDPDYFSNCDNQNPIRVIRALELIRISGEKMNKILKRDSIKRSFKTRFFILDWPREQLYERINLRVDMMVEQGLIQEVSDLIPYRNKQALQTVGYKELFDHFDGKTDLKTAIDLIKQNSRRYAKRQVTWFKRYENATWVKPQDFDNCAALLQDEN